MREEIWLFIAFATGAVMFFAGLYGQYSTVEVSCPQTYHISMSTQECPTAQAQAETCKEVLKDAARIAKETRDGLDPYLSNATRAWTYD